MKEIQSRNEMAKKVFMDKKKLFTGKMNLELKKRIMKCLVWSVALYAAETWTVTQTDRRLEAFEMWIWRRIDKKRVNEDRQILNLFGKGNVDGLAHVLRHDGLLHEIIEGSRMRGELTSGRRRIQMLHNLANDGGFVVFKQVAEDRERMS